MLEIKYLDAKPKNVFGNLFCWIIVRVMSIIRIHFYDLATFGSKECYEKNEKNRFIRKRYVHVMEIFH